MKALGFVALYAALLFGPIPFLPHAIASGHTDLSPVVAADAVHPGDNYGVFAGERAIYVIDQITPWKIRMVDGRLVHDGVVMNKLLPVHTYTDATPAERALWGKYFS